MKRNRADRLYLFMHFEIKHTKIIYSLNPNSSPNLGFFSILYTIIFLIDYIRKSNFLIINLLEFSKLVNSLCPFI